MDEDVVPDLSADRTQNEDYARRVATTRRRHGTGPFDKLRERADPRLGGRRSAQTKAGRGKVVSLARTTIEGED